MAFILPISEIENNIIVGCEPCVEEDGVLSNATHVEIEIDTNDPEYGSSLTGLCANHVLDRNRD